MKEISVSLLPHFVWKSQPIKGTFCHFHSSENEWIWMNIWLNSDGEPLLSFQLIYFRNSFCYRKESSWGFRYKILDHVGPLGKNLNFFVSLGIAEILGFSELFVYTEVVLLKATLWIMPLLQILKKLWSFII